MYKSKLSEAQWEQVKTLREEGCSWDKISGKVEELYQIKVTSNCLRVGYLRRFSVKGEGLKTGEYNLGQPSKPKAKPGLKRRYSRKKKKISPVKKKDPAFGDIGAVLSEIKSLIDEVEVLFADQLHEIRGRLIEVKGKLVKATQ